MAMLKLKVPIVRQPEGKMWCGPASAAMICNYHGLRVSVAEMADALPMTDEGIDLGSLGSLFLENGFDVVIKFWHPGLKPAARGASTATDRVRVTKALLGPLRFNNFRLNENVAGLARFIGRGGKLILDALAYNDFVQEILTSAPFIVNFDYKTLHRQGDAGAGHYGVVSGLNLKNRDVRLIDPNDGRVTLPADELLFACHIWDGAAIFVRPKEQ